MIHRLLNKFDETHGKLAFNEFDETHDTNDALGTRYASLFVLPKFAVQQACVLKYLRWSNAHIVEIDCQAPSGPTTLLALPALDDWDK